MKYTTLISAHELSQIAPYSDTVIIDCRFNLMDGEAGFTAYRHGHLPNARYAHLDKDLSSRITDFTGRHPLPEMKALIAKIGLWGVGNATQVVVYDEANGMFASRLWWLMRYLGYDLVAVLDGGMKNWRASGLPLTTVLPSITPKSFRAYPGFNATLSAIEVQNGLARKSICLIDARMPDRFLGLQEPIDPVAGHVPGAVNRPFQSNLSDTGLFLSADELRRQFEGVTGRFDPEQTVHMCGSGVTACHNILAMEIAGLHGSKLYAGSWSEWIRDKNRPVAHS